ncbi:hypothetical protein EIN_063480 [Entamoeba invadens IP1]|uniref:hypothetical protein n=1 Tax=Entamoeba invadens IP1 TaxID=370355 RepID=UPI0002C3DF88|nr:hypothetical protein EIN_063480 [Entamoeba invadens IP1]ELP93603.1 hypothetical protein EIN_063480 [Entamoeba invadens IP1]|eukprot:XP_004260374.1 hypothetical protein EIN_063480 [Entamoeba invadens IP1]
MLTSKRGGIVYDKLTDFNEVIMRGCVSMSHYFVFDSLDKALCFLDRVIQVGCYGDASVSKEKHKIWIKRICCNTEYKKVKEKTSKVGCDAHAFIREVQLRTIISGNGFKHEQVIFNIDNKIYALHPNAVLKSFDSKLYGEKYSTTIKKKVVLVTVAKPHSEACRRQMLEKGYQLKHRRDKEDRPERVDGNEKIRDGDNFDIFEKTAAQQDVEKGNRREFQPPPPLQSPFVICQQPFSQSDRQESHGTVKCAFTQGVVSCYDGELCVMRNEEDLSQKYLSRIDELMNEALTDFQKSPYDQRLQVFTQTLQEAKRVFTQ